MRADRLLLIVQLLRRYGRMSAADLARRLEVTKRTVLRDMEALSAAGIPVYAERGRGGGFALVPGFEPDAEQLTAEEARALFVAGAGAPRTRSDWATRSAVRCTNCPPRCPTSSTGWSPMYRTG
ncbi:MAG: HTH domain-containing protein [Nocardia sp.]|nr:HTH domain-containing protein [Nocardia sp.]